MLTTNSVLLLENPAQDNYLRYAEGSFFREWGPTIYAALSKCTHFFKPLLEQAQQHEVNVKSVDRRGIFFDLFFSLWENFRIQKRLS